MGGTVIRPFISQRQIRQGVTMSYLRFAPVRLHLAFFTVVVTGCPMDDAGGVELPGLDISSDAGPDAVSAATDAAAESALDDPVERSVALVLAAADLPPQYVCLGAFAMDESGAPVGDPVIAGGPFGVPDLTDPARRRLVSGFPYGSVVRLPLRRHDAKYFDGHAPVGYIVDDVQPREFAGSGNDSETCKRAWASARDVAARQLKLGAMRVGDSWIAGVSGCAAASSAPECGGGVNLRTTPAPLDLAPAPAQTVDGELALTLQVANVSALADFQNIDMYLQAVRPEEGGKIPDGPPIALAVSGLSRGDVAPSTVVVHLPSANAGDALLLVVAHDAPPCVSGPDCRTAAIPIDPFRARYASARGGATGAAWSGHQVLALFGRPPSNPEEPTGALYLGMFDAALP
jgi:hypothetical protein